MKIVRVCAISHPFRRRSFTAPTSEPRSRRRYTHPRWRSQPPSSLPGNWSLRHPLIQRSRYLRATTGQAEVRRSAIIPISWSEASSHGFDFQDLLQCLALDLAKPDVPRVGGMTELRRIAALTPAAGVRLVPHTWRSSR
jgi:hypothetical protein